MIKVSKIASANCHSSNAEHDYEEVLFTCAQDLTGQVNGTNDNELKTKENRFAAKKRSGQERGLSS